jgi:O-antigen ligase
LLIEGDLAARTDLEREPVTLAAVLTAGLVAGILLGHPVAAAILAAILLVGWRLAGFAGVFVACLGVLALASSSIEEVKTAATDERWVALGTLALWPVVSGRRPRLAPARLLLAGGAALVGLALLSVSWSVDPGLTARRALAFAALVFIALVVVPTHAATRQERRTLVVSLAVLCAIGALGAVLVAIVSPSLARSTPTAFAYFNGLPSLPDLGPLRGWAESTQTVGIWCALLLPFLIAWRRRPIWIPLAALSVVVALWSYSRAALVVLILTLIVHAWIAWPRRAAFAGLAIALVVVATPLRTTLVTNSALTKFHRTGSGERALFGGRLEAWDATVDLVHAAPAGGYGFGTGDRLFQLSRANNRFVYFNGDNAADGYLEALVEVGPLGLLAVLAAFAGGIGSAVRRRRWRDPFLLVGASFAVIGVTESVFTSPGSPFTLLMWSCLALAATPVAVATRARTRDLEPAEVLLRPEDELAELTGGLEEERVVATNGRHERVPLHAGSGNGKGHLLGVEVGEERQAQSGVPGDRPA